MKVFPVVSEKDLRTFVAAANGFIQKFKQQDFNQADRDAANTLVKSLSAANLIQLHGHDIDLSDEMIRNAVSAQKVTAILAEQIRNAVREVFYQFYCGWLRTPGSGQDSVARATQIMHALKSVAEWACVSIGYQLMYADAGERVSEAEDVFRLMLHRSPAAVFFCAEIHANGLIKSERTGDRTYDFEEALQLYGKNLRHEVSVQNGVFYVRSAIRYAEIVLKHDLTEGKLDFITDILVKCKAMIAQGNVRVPAADSASLLSALSGVFNRQIFMLSDVVLNGAVSAGHLDKAGSELLKNKLGTSSNHYSDAVMNIAAI